MVGLVDRLASPSEGLSSDPNAANEGKGLLLRFDQRLSQLLISLLGLPKH